MPEEGFTLKPVDITGDIRQAVNTGGAHVLTYLDTYAFADYEIGMMREIPADRAVVVFVGDREHADEVARLAVEVAAKGRAAGEPDG